MRIIQDTSRQPEHGGRILPRIIFLVRAQSRARKHRRGPGRRSNGYIPVEMTNAPTNVPSRDLPGFAARWGAARLLEGVLRRHRPLDEQWDDLCANPNFQGLAERDRALVRRIAATVLRRLGT